MPVVKSSFFFLLATSTLIAAPAFATKCLKAQTIAELKEVFPAVVKGVVEERKEIGKDEQSYSLKIRIEKYFKGDLGLKELNAIETHHGRGLPRAYEVGKSYTFAVDFKNKGGAYEVILPADGCPELPKE